MFGEVEGEQEAMIELFPACGLEKEWGTAEVMTQRRVVARL